MHVSRGALHRLLKPGANSGGVPTPDEDSCSKTDVCTVGWTRSKLCDCSASRPRGSTVGAGAGRFSERFSAGVRCPAGRPVRANPLRRLPRVPAAQVLFNAIPPGQQTRREHLQRRYFIEDCAPYSGCRRYLARRSFGSPACNSSSRRSPVRGFSTRAQNCLQEPNAWVNSPTQDRSVLLPSALAP